VLINHYFQSAWFISAKELLKANSYHLKSTCR
jgi:hypothetical protein